MLGRGATSKVTAKGSASKGGDPQKVKANLRGSQEYKKGSTKVIGQLLETNKAAQAAKGFGRGLFFGLKVTQIKNPYDGKIPVKSVSESYEVPNLSTTRGREEIQKAGTNSNLRKAYKYIFDSEIKQHTIPVKNISFNGVPYEVTINKKAISKVLSGAGITNTAPEKLAVFDDLDSVISNGRYVGSGKFMPEGKRQKETIRFDYFETPIIIDGNKWVCVFDVEVFPNVNNYKTHRVVNEINLHQQSITDVSHSLTAKESDASLSINVLQRNLENVNKERTPRVLNMAKAPQPTSETPNAPTLSTSRIADSGGNVKGASQYDIDTPTYMLRKPPKKIDSVSGNEIGADRNRYGYDEMTSKFKTNTIENS